MEQAGRTVRQSRRKLRAQWQKIAWLGETQAALGWGVILFLAAVVGALYVSQASRIAATGRAVQLLQRDLENLKRENGALERDIAQAQSLSRLEGEAGRLGFVRPGPNDIEYLIVSDYPAGDWQPPAAATPEPTPAQPVETLGEALWVGFTQNVRHLIRGEASDDQ